MTHFQPSPREHGTYHRPVPHPLPEEVCRPLRVEVSGPSKAASYPFVRPSVHPATTSHGGVGYRLSDQVSAQRHRRLLSPHRGQQQ